jgi:hypothetical protein
MLSLRYGRLARRVYQITRIVDGLHAAMWTFKFLSITLKLGLLGEEEVGKRIRDFGVLERLEAFLAAEHPDGHN